VEGGGVREPGAEFRALRLCATPEGRLAHYTPMAESRRHREFCARRRLLARGSASKSARFNQILKSMRVTRDRLTPAHGTRARAGAAGSASTSAGAARLRKLGRIGALGRSIVPVYGHGRASRGTRAGTQVEAGARYCVMWGAGRGSPQARTCTTNTGVNGLFKNPQDVILPAAAPTMPAEATYYR